MWMTWGNSFGRSVWQSIMRPPSFRKRDELSIVSWDFSEAAGGPVALRLLDALFRARDEVPPDVALAVERRAAEEHHVRGLGRGDCRREAGAKQDHGALAVH